MSDVPLPDRLTATVEEETVHGRTLPRVALFLDGNPLGFNPVCDVRHVEGVDNELLISKNVGHSVYVTRFVIGDNGLAQRYIPNAVEDEYAQSLDDLDGLMDAITDGNSDRSVYIPSRSDIARQRFRWDNLDALDDRDPVPFSPTPTWDTTRYVEPTDRELCRGCGQEALFVEKRVTVDQRVWLGQVVQSDKSSYECCERCGADDLFDRRELYAQYREKVGYFLDEESEREEADMHALRVEEIDDHLEAAMTDAGNLERELVFGSDESRVVTTGTDWDLSEEEFATIFG